MACDVPADQPESAPARGQGVTNERADLEHRVRTELTTISLASQLILRERLTSERQRQLVAEILQACGHLQHCLAEWIELTGNVPPRS